MKHVAVIALLLAPACGSAQKAAPAASAQTAEPSFQPMRVDLRIEHRGAIIAQPRLTTPLGEPAQVRLATGDSSLRLDAVVARSQGSLELSLAVQSDAGPIIRRTVGATPGQPVTWELDELRITATLQQITIYRTAFWFQGVSTEMLQPAAEGALHPSLGESGLGGGQDHAIPQSPLPVGTGF